MREMKGKDTEIDDLNRQLTAVKAENMGLKKSLDKYKDAYQTNDAMQLINECRSKSRKRE